MIVQTEAARLLLYRAAANAGHGAPDALEASIAKCFANEAAKRISDSAVQLLGGYGYTDEYEVERLHRDAHGWAIAGGTPNMQRIRIVSEYLGRRFEQRPEPAGVSATATQRATDAVRSMIVRQRLAPGQQVLQEELAEELGLSRSPLREALRALESEGLVRYAAEPRVLRHARQPGRAPADLPDARPARDRPSSARFRPRPTKPSSRSSDSTPRWRRRLAGRAPVGESALPLRDLRALRARCGRRQLDRLWNLAEPYQATYAAQPSARGRIVHEHGEMLDALRRNDVGRLIAIADAHRTASEATVLATLLV